MWGERTAFICNSWNICFETLVCKTSHLFRNIPLLPVQPWSDRRRKRSWAVRLSEKMPLIWLTRKLKHLQKHFFSTIIKSWQAQLPLITVLYCRPTHALCMCDMSKSKLTLLSNMLYTNNIYSINETTVLSEPRCSKVINKNYYNEAKLNYLN